MENSHNQFNGKAVSLMDNVLTLRKIVEKRTTTDLNTELVFVELEKVYDSVPFNKFYKVVQMTGEYIV